MFARVFALLPLALLVSASPFMKARQDQCPTGPATCCTTGTASDMSKTSNDQMVVALLSAFKPDTQVGTDCSPLQAVAVGNGCSANQEPVCCNNNSFNGLVNIGCSPINLGL